MMRQVSEHPAIMVPAFDRKQAVAVIYKLASSGNELIRFYILLFIFIILKIRKIICYC